jgi:hypothetical protein
MPNAANALQKAIYETLAADPELVSLLGDNGVFDHRVTGKPMPYLVISDITTTDFGPEAEEHMMTIEAWSDRPGRLEVQSIAGRVMELFEEVQPTLSDSILVNLQHRTTRVRREAKTNALLAEMSFRAVTE